MGKHTATFKGRRVRLVLKNGTFLEGRFVHRQPNGLIVLDTGKVHKRLVLRLLALKGGKAQQR